MNGAGFGDGAGRIWLTDVECTGSEGVLSNCTSSRAVSTCVHSQDAGVRCPLGM